MRVGRWAQRGAFVLAEGKFVDTTQRRDGAASCWANTKRGNGIAPEVLDEHHLGIEEDLRLVLLQAENGHLD